MDKEDEVESGKNQEAEGDKCNNIEEEDKEEAPATEKATEEE